MNGSNWLAVSIVIGAVINTATFSYFYGRLQQRVDDHANRILRLETMQDQRIDDHASRIMRLESNVRASAAGAS